MSSKERAEVLRDSGGVFLEPAVGHAKHAKPFSLKRRVTPPVGLEGRARAVELEAVDLHHEAAVEPRGVDLLAGDEEVHRRPWQAGAVADLDEEVLEARPRDRGAGAVAPDGLLQRTDPPLALAAAADLIDRPEIEQA